MRRGACAQAQAWARFQVFTLESLGMNKEGRGREGCAACVQNFRAAHGNSLKPKQRRQTAPEGGRGRQGAGTRAARVGGGLGRTRITQDLVSPEDFGQAGDVFRFMFRKHGHLKRAATSGL